MGTADDLLKPIYFYRIYDYGIIIILGFFHVKKVKQLMMIRFQFIKQLPQNANSLLTENYNENAHI